MLSDLLNDKLHLRPTFCSYYRHYAPAQGALSDDTVWRLSRTYIGRKSRTEIEAYRKTKIGKEVAHVTHHFQGQKVKGQGHQAALVECTGNHIESVTDPYMRVWCISCHHLQAWAEAYCGGLPPTACFFCHWICLTHCDAIPVPHWTSSSCEYSTKIFIIFYTLGIKDPEGFGKELEENCRSDQYPGQSSNTKESCSSTPLNRCTSTETRWNKKAVSRSSPEWWLIFFARSEKKSEADSLIGPSVSTTIGWKR